MTERILDDRQLDIKMSEHFKHYTDIAETAGGNQIIVRINELIKIISVECYDRYMGLLTLNDFQS